MGAALLELDIRLAEGSLLPFLSERDTTSFLIYRDLPLTTYTTPLVPGRKITSRNPLSLAICSYTQMPVLL